MRRAWSFFIAQLVGFGVALAASARTLEIVCQQLGDNSVVRTHALGPLLFHVDHVLRGLIVGCGPVALLRMGAGHKDNGAQQLQDSVTHDLSSNYL